MLLIDRLIEILCAERGETVPKLEAEQKPDYFRALCNVRPPMPVTAEFLALQDEYLTAKKLECGVTDVNNFSYFSGVALFKGDVTTLNAEAVKEFISQEKLAPKVIFNVFTEEDYGIYNRILEENK